MRGRLGMLGRGLALALAFTFASGCASDPNNPLGLITPPPGTDYGAPPGDLQAGAREHFMALLRDPGSAQYRFGRVGPAYCNEVYVNRTELAWVGQAAQVYVNARNGFGGYAGFEPYVLLYNADGSVARAIEGEGFGRRFLPPFCAWADDAASAGESADVRRSP